MNTTQGSNNDGSDRGQATTITPGQSSVFSSSNQALATPATQGQRVGYNPGFTSYGSAISFIAATSVVVDLLCTVLTGLSIWFFRQLYTTEQSMSEWKIPALKKLCEEEATGPTALTISGLVLTSVVTFLLLCQSIIACLLCQGRHRAQLDGDTCRITMYICMGIILLLIQIPCITIQILGTLAAEGVVAVVGKLDRVYTYYYYVYGISELTLKYYGNIVAIIAGCISLITRVWCIYEAIKTKKQSDNNRNNQQQVGETGGGAMQSISRYDAMVPQYHMPMVGPPMMMYSSPYYMNPTTIVPVQLVPTQSQPAVVTPSAAV